MHYALLAWGTQCHKLKLLQKKALRVIFSKSPKPSVLRVKRFTLRVKQLVLSVKQCIKI